MRRSLAVQRSPAVLILSVVRAGKVITAFFFADSTETAFHVFQVRYKNIADPNRVLVVIKYFADEHIFHYVFLGSSASTLDSVPWTTPNLYGPSQRMLRQLVYVLGWNGIGERTRGRNRSDVHSYRCFRHN